MKQLGRAVLLAFVACACGGSEVGRDGGQGNDGGGRDAAPAAICSAAHDCDDGLHCTGTERCEPGALGAGPDGCVAGTPPCATGEICDEPTARCVPDDCANPDADNDGHDRIGCGAGDDCDDTDPNRFPGNPEVCDPFGHDEDCDPTTISGEPDKDRDGHIDHACWNVRDDGSENRGTDCDDSRNTVNPDAVESCNGVDDDCDGMIDEGVLETFYRDFDGDNYGRTAETVMACSRPVGYALVGGDCDDGETGNAYSPTVNPAAVEVCNGRDDDCDGLTDPGCACTDTATQPCGFDIGECRVGTQTCSGGMWGGCVGNTGPATETCNGLDDDCDGMTDEGLLRQFWRDADNDGAGNPAISTMACTAPTGYVDNDDDCDDTTAAVRPGNVEATYPCDGLDNDCDGRIDEAGNDQRACYRDLDGDGYGAGPNVPACTCLPGWVSTPGDCVDTGARAHLIHPGAGFQTVGHCAGEEPCDSPLVGAKGCMQKTGCGGPGQPICLCTEPAQWDYDCSGTVTPASVGLSCTSTGPLMCRNHRGPASPAAPSACGTTVPHTGGCVAASLPACVTQADGPALLGCR